MRRLITAVTAALLLATAAPAQSAPAAYQGGAESSTLSIINAGRRANGRTNLTSNTALRSVAREHSVEMARRGGINHAGFNGRIARAGFKGNFAACENVAMFRQSRTSSTAAVARKFYSLWLNSPPHRRCMFDAARAGYTSAGVGIYRDARGAYWATLELAGKGASRGQATGGGPRKPATPRR